MPRPSPIIILRGAGDLASGVALRLFRAGLRRLVLLEAAHPLAVRRTVSFSEAVYGGCAVVEGTTARLAQTPEEVRTAWEHGELPVLVDPDGSQIPRLSPEVLVDAILAKRNLGTRLDQAPLVIGLGPGFSAGEDVHAVVETKRGHHLGRVIRTGPAATNTGVPGTIGGYALERVYWADRKGVFRTPHDIGDRIREGEVLGTVGNTPVTARLSGVIRGLLRDGTPVRTRTKLGDIDPRGAVSYCGEVSDKALAIGGGVLEAVSAHLLSGLSA